MTWYPESYDDDLDGPQHGRAELDRADAYGTDREPTPIQAATHRLDCSRAGCTGCDYEY